MEKVILKLSSKVNKLCNNKELKESSIKIGDPDYRSRIRKRLTDLNRAKALAKEALEKVIAEGDSKLADELTNKINEIQQLIDDCNTDLLGSEGEIDTASNNNENSDEVDNNSESDSELDSESEDSDQDNNNENNSSRDSVENSKDTPYNSNKDGEENESNQPKENNNDDELEGEFEDSEDLDNSDDIGDSEDTDNSGDSDSGSKNGQKEEPKDSDNETGKDPEDNSDNESNSESDDLEDDSEENSENSENKNKENDVKDSGNETDTEDTESNDEDETDEDSSKKDNRSDNKDNNDKKDSKKEESEDSDEEDESNTDIIKNPFADEEDIPTPPSGKSEGEPREATVDDIIDQLSHLNEKSKQGAIDAIKDLINNSKNESLSSKTKRLSLEEALKNVREMTDDEFGDYINGVYDLIDKVNPVEYVDDIGERKKKINIWSNDPLVAQELAQEDNVEIQKDFQAVKAREKEKEKYNKVEKLEDFVLDVYSAVKHQIDLVKETYLSYNEINNEYEDSGLIMKTEIEREVPDDAWPIIDVYFDVSGSWSNREINIGLKALASLQEFEDAGELTINRLYFANVVGNSIQDAQREGKGTLAWPKILQNIKATKATNVLVMTDDDIGTFDKQADGYDIPYGYSKAAYMHAIRPYCAKYGAYYTVTGCVWYLWRDNYRSPECTKHLTGKQGTYQYSFSSR